MKLMHSLFVSCLISVLWSVTCYAGQPAGTGLNILMEAKDGRVIINCQGTTIDPAEMGAILVVDGSPTGVSAVFRDGDTLVPLQAFREKLGVATAVDDTTLTARLTRGRNTISLTVGKNEALVNERTVNIPVPAELIGQDIYIPLKSIAENLDFTVAVKMDFLLFDGYDPEKYENIRDKSGMTAIFIEGKPVILSPLSSGQALRSLKSQMSMKYIQNYQPKKSGADIYNFLDEIEYKQGETTFGRYHYIEIHFYNQWSKRFESAAYVDGYTGRIFIGDARYGYTEDFSAYLTQKYNNHLPLETKPAKVVPFSKISLDTGGDFIQVNFPEQILSNALKETYYLQEEPKKNNGRVFISHGNSSGQTIDYIIRFKNTAHEDNNIKLLEGKAVHTTEPYKEQVIIEMLESFHRSSLADEYNEIKLAPGEYYDATIDGIGDGCFFTALIDYVSSGGVAVTVFAVPAGQVTDMTPDIPYDFDYKPTSYIPAESAREKNLRYYSVYSGTGEGYRVLAEGNLLASEMTGDNGYNIAFETGGSLDNINQRNGLSEIVELSLSTPVTEEGDRRKAIWGGFLQYKGGADRTDPNNPRTYGNTGNWCVEYDITVRLTNDTDKDKVFSCELTPTNQTIWAFINDGGPAAVTLTNRKYQATFRRQTGKDFDSIHIGSGIRSGNIGAVEVKAGESLEYRYTYVLGTDCESGVFHVWTCIDTK